MKNCKAIIILFISLLFSILNIGVVKAAQKNIEVEGVSIKDKSGTIDVVEPVLVSNNITSNITFNKIDDYVIFEVKIKNNEEDKYKIESIQDNNSNANIDIEYNYNDSYISKGENGTFTVKIIYKNKLINIDKIDLNNIEITVNLLNDQGEGSNIVINNPVTGDNIFMYVILFILALSGLIFVTKKIRYKGIKVGSIVLLLAITMIPFTIFALEKYEIVFKFSDIEIKGEFEKYNISINLDNGSDLITREITYGNKIGELPGSFTKDGYTFSKWEDDEGNEVNENTIITKPISITAKYNLVEYTISYNLNGGSVSQVNPDKYTIESSDIVLNNPTKTGYTFTGWTGSGIDNITTSLTIESGSFGNKEYVANYSANDDTPYKVIHRKQKVTLDGYDDYTDVLYGTTDMSITPSVNTYTGFISPSTKTVPISGNGDTEVVYEYDRVKVNYSFGENITSSVVSGLVPYEKEIVVTANEVEGMTFTKWNNDETTNPLTIVVGLDDINIEATYSVKKVTVTFNTDGGTEIPSQERYYNELATRPDAPFKNGYEFVNWYADSDLTVVYNFNSLLKDDTTIYAKYIKDNFPVVFKHEGACTFNGADGVLTGTDCEFANGVNKYIDTGVNLYDSENHDKDYEIGFTIVSYEINSNQDSKATFMNTKYEGTNNPGVVFRRKFNGSAFDLSARKTTSANETQLFDYGSVQKVKIFRIYNKDTDTQEIFYSINDSARVKLNDLSTFNPEFDLSVWFGASPKNASATEVQRYLTGTLSNMYIKVGEFFDNYAKVTFDTDGGSLVSALEIKKGTNAFRPLYTPFKEGYSFVGWYADSEYTTLFDFNTIIYDDTTIYAKYIEDDFSLVFKHEGACTFNGANGVITGDNCAFANGAYKFIDTKVKLYDSINHDKDFEIGFTIESLDFDNMVTQSTIMNIKYEASNYPGLVFRRRNSTDTLEVVSRKSSSENSLQTFSASSVNNVRIYRIYNSSLGVQEIYYRINDGAKVLLTDLSEFNPEFNLNVWFGASPKNEDGSYAQRYLNGTISNMYIRVGTYNGD